MRNPMSRPSSSSAMMLVEEKFVKNRS